MTCDLCHHKFNWHEVVISYLNTNGTRLDFCLSCSYQHPVSRSPEVKWGVSQYGDNSITYEE